MVIGILKATGVLKQGIWQNYDVDNVAQGLQVRGRWEGGEGATFATCQVVQWDCMRGTYVYLLGSTRGSYLLLLPADSGT